MSGRADPARRPGPEPAVVPLRAALDARRFGGKAAHLAQALGFGLPVPAGVALSVEAVEAAVAGDAAPLAAVAALLGAAATGPLAVRSSAVGEDGAATSFAGQLVTELNVIGEGALREAVAAIHASARSAVAAAYRERLGATVVARSGAVVQPLLPADAAGVAFTRDPLGGPHVVVEASWGLGEAVVGGLVTPDLYRVARGADGTAGAVVERSVGAKEVRVTPLRGGGVEEVAAADATAALLCLADTELLAVVALALACEQRFGSAQDVEWALAGGRLWLLQSRPVTR